MTDVFSELLVSIEAREAAKLDRLMEEARAYANHLKAGGDPGKPASGGSWYNNPLGSYALEILNAFRSASGQPPTPFSVSQYHVTRTFDMLRAGWVPAKKVLALSRARMDTHFKARKMESLGYRIEKDTIDGAVNYRLVTIAEVVNG